MCMFKIKTMCSHFFYTVQVITVYQKGLYNSCLFLLLRYRLQVTKEHILPQVRLHRVLLKKIICV